MEPFTITLANGATLTGLSSLPVTSPTSPKYRPLVVGIHGGSYCATYFDVDAHCSAAIFSNALYVPFVAINRPGYRGSITLYPLPPDSSDLETQASWLHSYILPVLWTTFGLPQGCNSLVLHCHSLGTPSAIIAASYLARCSDPKPPYPLAGIIFSGYGIDLLTESSAQMDPNAPFPEFLDFPVEAKDSLFLPPGTCDTSMYSHTDRLNTKFPFREVQDTHTVWLPRVRSEWAGEVNVPVMFGIAELDCYWKATGEHVNALREVFKSSPRVEGAVVKGAPHNLEMSYWAQGWYARCFGFGLECAASFGVKGREAE